MLEHLASHWWLLALRGVFAVLFGIMALVWPGITVWALVVLWGAYALLDGVVNIGAGITGAGGGGAGGRIWEVLLGLLGVGAGIIAFAWPGVTAVVLLWFIGVWALVGGIMQIVGAIMLRREITNEWLLVASGALSILLGGLLLARPGAGVLAVVWAIAIFAIAHGVAMVLLSIRLRGLGRTDMRMAA